MNKIWVTIILISIIFGIVTNNTKNMVEELFKVPENVLNSLLKIGSMLIIYSGLFQIAIDSNVIKKLSYFLKGVVNFLFKTNDNEIKELISASIIANMLGLGAANMAIALKTIEKINNTSLNKEYNLTMYLVINISSLCLLPLSTLAFRETFKAYINISFIPLLFIVSFLSTILGIILVKVSKFDE